MDWWKSALYDTCSLITLDKLLQNQTGIPPWFPKKVLALEVSLSEDQMYAETAERVKGFVELCPLPTPTKLKNLLSSVLLSNAFSNVDKLVFATAVDAKIAVVTGDKQLAKAVQKKGIKVGNIALILRELVKTRKLEPTAVENILQALADQKDYLLGGIPKPTWKDLEGYTFPD